MGEYMLIVLEDAAAHAAQAPAAIATLIDERARFADELRRAGALRDCGWFRRAGAIVEDGKLFAGYYWIDAPSVDDAARIATAVPVLAVDEIAVRPLMKGKIEGDKEKPGKIVGCVVRGSGASEAAWTSVMDRIDAETHAGFPAVGFLGGNRLEAPSTGRRVRERRAMQDGPFLETREVIGGVFFVRMANVEDAVRWAQTTPFVVHGTLEIRELWR